MALEAPNFFNELERMRKSSRRYDPNYDYSRIIEQLTTACQTFEMYLAISPQNLVLPAELLPVIAMRVGQSFPAFVDPQLVRTKGARERWEACANIYLMKQGEKIHPGVRTMRPTHIVVSVAAQNGIRVLTDFSDTEPVESTENGFVGAFCHELDHLQGRLITDIARESLEQAMSKLAEEDDPLFRAHVRLSMPLVLIREGDTYVIRHGSELEGSTIPPVSPDTLFAHGFFGPLEEVKSLRVPRDGELVPIKASRVVRLMYK